MTNSIRVSTFLGDFNAAVDRFVTSGVKTDFATAMDQYGLTTADMEELNAAVLNQLNEWEEVVLGTDEQLIEGYSNLTKAQQREILEMYYVITEYTPAKRTRVSKPKADKVYKTEATPKKEVVLTGDKGLVVAMIPAWKKVHVWENARTNGTVVEFDSAYEISLTAKITCEIDETMTLDEVNAILASLAYRKTELNLTAKISSKAAAVMSFTK